MQTFLFKLLILKFGIFNEGFFFSSKPKYRSSCFSLNKYSWLSYHPLNVRSFGCERLITWRGWKPFLKFKLNHRCGICCQHPKNSFSIHQLTILCWKYNALHSEWVPKVIIKNIINRAHSLNSTRVWSQQQLWLMEINKSFLVQTQCLLSIAWD